LKGFLGTAAPLYADVVLMLEMCMGVVLLAGAVLARNAEISRACMLPVHSCAGQLGNHSAGDGPGFWQAGRA
jgi:hypothetical protein